MSKINEIENRIEMSVKNLRQNITDKYKNVHEIVRFNHIEDNTYGVIKRSPFPYFISIKSSEINLENKFFDNNIWKQLSLFL